MTAVEERPQSPNDKAGATRTALTTHYGYLFKVSEKKNSQVPRYMKNAPPPREIEERGACGPDTAHVFDDTTPEGLKAAKEVCGTCPEDIQDKCLDWAVRNGETGVHGGVRVTLAMIKGRE